MPPITIKVGSATKTISSGMVTEIQDAFGISTEQELLDTIRTFIKRRIRRKLRTESFNVKMEDIDI